MLIRWYDDDMTNDDMMHLRCDDMMIDDLEIWWHDVIWWRDGLMIWRYDVHDTNMTIWWYDVMMICDDIWFDEMGTCFSDDDMMICYDAVMLWWYDDMIWYDVVWWYDDMKIHNECILGKWLGPTAKSLHILNEFIGYLCMTCLYCTFLLCAYALIYVYKNIYIYIYIFFWCFWSFVYKITCV